MSQSASACSNTLWFTLQSKPRLLLWSKFRVMYLSPKSGLFPPPPVDRFKILQGSIVKGEAEMMRWLDKLQMTSWDPTKQQHLQSCFMEGSHAVRATKNLIVVSHGIAWPVIDLKSAAFSTLEDLLEACFGRRWGCLRSCSAFISAWQKCGSRLKSNVCGQMLPTTQKGGA